MKYMNAIAAGVVSLVLTGCVASPAPSDAGAQPIAISPTTQSALSTYLQQVKTTRPGAFAVSEDGADSYFVWCEEMTCVDISYATPAVQRCESLSGKHCVTLFVRDHPRTAFAQASKGDGAGRHGSKKSMPVEFLNVRSF